MRSANGLELYPVRSGDEMAVYERGIYQMNGFARGDKSCFEEKSMAEAIFAAIAGATKVGGAATTVEEISKTLY